jgi:hypothetical protein
LYYENKRLGCALYGRNPKQILISTVYRELDIG